MKIVMVLTSHDQSVVQHWPQDLVLACKSLRAYRTLSLEMPECSHHLLLLQAANHRSIERATSLENQTDAMALFKRDAVAQLWPWFGAAGLADVKAEDYDSIFDVGGHVPWWISSTTLSRSL